jgi:hypothetical protein
VKKHTFLSVFLISFLIASSASTKFASAQTDFTAYNGKEISDSQIDGKIGPNGTMQAATKIQLLIHGALRTFGPSKTEPTST